MSPTRSRIAATLATVTLALFAGAVTLSSAASPAAAQTHADVSQTHA
jgi:hypothetical protein